MNQKIAQSGGQEYEDALAWCIKVCDFAIENYKGPIAMKIRREIAVEYQRRMKLVPDEVGI